MPAQQQAVDVARKLFDDMHKLKLTFVLAVLFALACSPIGGGMSTNTLVKESVNKRHTKKAILFLKESGATVADSYQVTIANVQHALDTINEVGNAFTADDNHGVTLLDTNSIVLTWLDNDTLQIDYDKKLRAFTQETHVDNVTIVYKLRDKTQL